MKKLQSPTAKMPIRSCGASTSWVLAWIQVPTQAHQMGTNTISARARPAQLWSCRSSAETWVTANTNTRSNRSSPQVTRLAAVPSWACVTLLVDLTGVAAAQRGTRLADDVVAATDDHGPDDEVEGQLQYRPQQRRRQPTDQY